MPLPKKSDRYDRFYAAALTGLVTSFKEGAITDHEVRTVIERARYIAEESLHQLQTSQS